MDKNITEDYVSYEVARLLQEKGFDEVCFACYEYFISGVTLYRGWMFEYKGESVRNTDERVKCPTLQMAMKWLREVHNFHVDIATSGENWESHIIELENLSYMDDGSIPICKTYEQAAEEAIKYCLEHIIL